jgi:ATP-dependent helicase HepA
MDDFSPGQRWISDAEPELGLGLVTAVERRTLNLVFPACNEERTYARNDPPISRVLFEVGETATSAAGWRLKVESIEYHQGMACYLGQQHDGSDGLLPETQLDHRIRLNRPADRLLRGRYDNVNWFELRYRTQRLRNRLARSELPGLTGGRTSLIPHQLYIAHEVSRRYAPRVLLADEVGLGKTIEAGMILHQQLLAGRARRILILVPESLQHQWLVEMLRRFNLRFSLFDEQRCQAIDHNTETDNPFHAEQLILVSSDFLSNNPDRLQQALAGEWDLLVVDEAHHLQWSEQAPSDEYLAVEQLAAVTPGILLLTATPEQLGKASHFARLRLLDPDRFHDYQTFIAEEAAYAPIAHCLHALLENDPLQAADLQLLNAHLGEGDNAALLEQVLARQIDPDEQQAARLALMDHLLDRHGTGRVLFRNTRAAIKGFPRRRLQMYSLPMPAAYRDRPASLHPETAHEHWVDSDPRIDWLIAHLQALQPDKVLLITAHADTAVQLAGALRQRSGLHAALFHEGMSLLERDRAAAFFADPEQGSRLLICSEIGSEGRNFQFAHHLVLFDLPFNPGLLEQRIGRLDRIGQRHDIQIHLPCLTPGPQQQLARFYHEALNAFEHSSPAAQTVFAEVSPALQQVLYEDAALEQLIDSSRIRHHQLEAALQQGRDPLLEYNSCRPHLAEDLLRQAQSEQQPLQLSDYLDHLFDCYDIDSEPLSGKAFLLRPGTRTPEGIFTGLDDNGLSCTADRATALANEELAYLSWEHPMVVSAMEASVGSGFGNSALCSLEKCGLRPGTLLLETIFLLQCNADSRLQASRYLPPTPLRLLLDEHGRSLGAQLPVNIIREKRKALSREQARQLIKHATPQINSLLRGSEAALRQQIPSLIQRASDQARQILGAEIDRLHALQLSNPNVREEEIAFFREELQQVVQAIEGSELHLDALRLIIAT